MFAQWVALFIGLLVVVRSEVDDCTRLQLDQCGNPLNGEDIAEIEGIFPKKEFLDQHCGPILSALQCRIDFNDRCPDSYAENEAALNRPMFNLVTSLCDDTSEIKKGYLDDVQCYDDNAQEVLICGATIYALVEDFVEEMRNRTDFSFGLELEPCIVVPAIMNCVVEEISEECGNQETIPLAQLLHRVSEIVRENVCPADKISIWEEEFNSYLEQEQKRKK